MMTQNNKIIDLHFWWWSFNFCLCIIIN